MVRQLGIAPGIARGAALGQEPHRAQGRIGREARGDDRFVGIEALTAGRPRPAGARGGKIPVQLARPQQVVDQAPTDAGLLGNRGLRQPLFQQVFF